MAKYGIIYIAQNSAYGKNVFKVGKSEREVRERMVELNSATGVIGKFDPVAFFAVNDIDSAEAKCHLVLRDYRVQPDREFFEIERDRLIEIVRDVANQYQVENLVPPSLPQSEVHNEEGALKLLEAPLQAILPHFLRLREKIGLRVHPESLVCQFYEDLGYTYQEIMARPDVDRRHDLIRRAEIRGKPISLPPESSSILIKPRYFNKPFVINRIVCVPNGQLFLESRLTSDLRDRNATILGVDNLTLQKCEYFVITNGDEYQIFSVANLIEPEPKGLGGFRISNTSNDMIRWGKELGKMANYSELIK